MNEKKNLSVCLSINQFNMYADKKSIVVVVDLLRATSVISTAFECGVKAVIPVETPEEALTYKNIPNHIIAAERNTLKIDGFDYGNSPYHYLNNDVNNKTLVLTTTNGTRAINLANNHQLITASFVNLNSVVEFITFKKRNVIILCSGWKGFFNLEDSIFAGALSQKLLKNNLYTANCDSLQASIQLYNNSKNNIYDFLNCSAYRKRNNSKEVLRDTRFCLQPNLNSSIVPIYKKDRLVEYKY